MPYFIVKLYLHKIVCRSLSPLTYVGRNYFCNKKMISNCYFILCLSRPIYFIKLKIRLGMNPTQIGIILESIDSDVKNDFKIVFEIKMFFYLPKKDIFRINLRTNSFFKIQDLQHKVLRRILLCPFHFIAH